MSGMASPAHAGHEHAVTRSTPGAPAVRDPVCGMSVDPSKAKHRLDHDGQTLFFCCQGCLEKFRADPQKYLTKTAAPAVAAAKPGQIWTCPMHPQIRRDGPGSCPICGMALEPLAPLGEEGPNPELLDMTRRFRVGVSLSM